MGPLAHVEILPEVGRGGLRSKIPKILLRNRSRLSVKYDWKAKEASICHPNIQVSFILIPPFSLGFLHLFFPLQLREGLRPGNLLQSLAQGEGVSAAPPSQFHSRLFFLLLFKTSESGAGSSAPLPCVSWENVAWRDGGEKKYQRSLQCFHTTELQSGPCGLQSSPFQN